MPFLATMRLLPSTVGAADEQGAVDAADEVAAAAPAQDVDVAPQQDFDFEMDDATERDRLPQEAEKRANEAIERARLAREAVKRASALCPPEHRTSTVCVTCLCPRGLFFFVFQSHTPSLYVTLEVPANDFAGTTF